jgi:hypothetical protein
LSRLARIGGALVAPVATFRHVLTARRGGLGDALAFALVAQIAFELPDLARAAALVDTVGAGGAALMALQSILGGLREPATIAILGAVALSLLGGRGRSGGVDLDLAALATVPYFFVRLVAALLAMTVSLRTMRPATYVAYAATAGALAAALYALRTTPPPPTPPRAEAGA